MPKVNVLFCPRPPTHFDTTARLASRDRLLANAPTSTDIDVTASKKRR